MRRPADRGEVIRVRQPDLIRVRGLKISIPHIAIGHKVREGRVVYVGAAAGGAVGVGARGDGVVDCGHAEAYDGHLEGVGVLDWGVVGRLVLDARLHVLRGREEDAQCWARRAVVESRVAHPGAHGGGVPGEQAAAPSVPAVLALAGTAIGRAGEVLEGYRLRRRLGVARGGGIIGCHCAWALTAVVELVRG
jgi:hypothetical protein